MDATSGSGVQEPAARIMVRPIASPLALGFLALAVGSFTLAGLELSWIPAVQDSYAGLGVLLFVFPLQAVSSVYGFLARDSVAGTGMGLLSGAWLVIGTLTFLSRHGQPSSALGLILLAVGTTMLVPAIVGLASKLLASAVMGSAALRFYLTAAYSLTGKPAWKYAAAAEGLCLVVLGVYSALAYEIEDASLRTILPTGRRGAGRQAMSGLMADELNQVHHEAGVRKQL